MDFETTCTGMATSAPVDPCIVVIFGITGDLARHDLVPALHALGNRDLLPERFALIGFARRDWNDETLRQEMHKFAQAEKSYNAERWPTFASEMYYSSGDFNAPADGAYVQLRTTIERIQRERNIPGNVLFHLSTPPSFYGDIMERLHASGLLDTTKGWRRVIIEKPFGHDEASARALDVRLAELIEEERLYRVDHFLGKETVQNMLVFRFANPSFEPIWNRQYIDHVQITAAEFEGIGTRGSFYEGTGVVRDMVQNHLLQLLCMTAMEAPVAYDGDALRDETVKVLRSIRPLDVENDCVLGQYAAGESGNSYREEDDVASDSRTPTFAAIKMHVDNWRWSGVPFYLRTGKRMERKRTSISVHFKPTPHVMFPNADANHLQSSVLTFQLYPNEGIYHTFLAKQPGPDVCVQPVTMRFRYDRAFGVDVLPNAYQWLFLDAMQGDQTLFPRSDWIEEAWSIVDPLIRQSETKGDVAVYRTGTWGPDAARGLMEDDGRLWQAPMADD